MKHLHPHWYAFAIAASFAEYKGSEASVKYRAGEITWNELWEAYKRHVIFRDAMLAAWKWRRNEVKIADLKRQYVRGSMTDKYFASSGRMAELTELINEVEREQIK